MRKIMVATDGSEGADRAVAFAAELAKSAGSKLLILTVSEDKLSPKLIDELQLGGIPESNALEEISRQILLRASARARECGAKEIETSVCVGDPAEMIIEAVKREKIDAVVMGRRGRGRLAGLILGSVSQKIASLAPCAVVIVP